MLSLEDKERLDEIFMAALKGEDTAYVACLFMSDEEKEYMQSLLNDYRRNPKRREKL